jgi:hypothetical protein
MHTESVKPAISDGGFLWTLVSGATVIATDLTRPVYEDSHGYLAIQLISAQMCLLLAQPYRSNDIVQHLNVPWHSLVVSDGRIPVRVNGAIRLMSVVQAAKIKMVGHL